ncbi:MAG: PAS domain S-box protein, partial [Mariprofundaceae bacterium]
QDGNNYYTHITVNPLSQVNNIPLIHHGVDQTYHWKMVSYLPEEIFINAVKPTLQRIIKFSTILTIFLLAGSLWLAIILTRKQQTYQLLEQSEDRYHQLYDNSPLGYQSLDGVGNFINTNDSLTSMLGYSKKELLDKNFADILSEPSKSKFQKNFPRFKKRGVVSNVEFELVHKNGSIIPISLDGRIAYDEDGKFKQTHCVISNISERKHAEKAVIAQHRLEATETLAGGIAHLINNHMASVVGTAGLLKMKHKHDSNLIDKLERIEISGMKGSELARELLAYAHGGQYESKIFNLNEIITSMEKPASEIIASINLQYHLDPELWNIKADSNQMRQIVEALINNAIEAIDHHGNINIHTENILIDDTISSPLPNFELGSYICLKVQDDGLGIDQDHLKKIFEPFFTTKFQGRGLGLAATYGIVKHGNGYITIDSELGNGSTFKIYIPNEPAQQKHIPGAKSITATAQLNILIADDETQVRNTLKEILDELGHNTITASNGKEAITAARKQLNTLDLIILDLAMPVMDGSQALPILKQNHPKAKIIIVSGYEINAKTQHILTADAFLQKPYEVKQLIDIIDEIFKEK